MKNFEWFEELNINDIYDEDEQNDNEVDSLNEDSSNSDSNELEESDNESPIQGDNKDKSKKPKESIPEKAKNVKDAIDTGKKIGKISNSLFCIKIGIEQSFIYIIYVSIPFRIYKNIPQMPINT